MPSTSKPCRNCGLRVGHRPGRICRACYEDPAIRERFPPVMRFLVSGLGIGNHASATPTIAITSPLGTDARIEELQRRVKAGESTSLSAGDSREWGA